MKVMREHFWSLGWSRSRQMEDAEVSSGLRSGLLSNGSFPWACMCMWWCVMFISALVMQSSVYQAMKNRSRGPPDQDLQIHSLHNVYKYKHNYNNAADRLKVSLHLPRTVMCLHKIYFFNSGMTFLPSFKYWICHLESFLTICQNNKDAMFSDMLYFFRQLNTNVLTSEE